MADGFPVTRQLSHVIAARRPDVPVLNGYLGDSLVRGSHDRCFGKLDRDTPDDLAAVLQRAHSLVGNRFDLIDSHVVQQIERRSLAAMRSLIERGSALGKRFLYFDLFGRQRHYISNNFLQHLDLAEAVVPFYNPGLIADRFAYDYTCFNWELYELLLRTQFPAIGDIPHNARLPESKKPRKISSASRQWATHLL